MIGIAQIEELVRCLEEAGLDTLEIEGPGQELRLTLRRPPGAPRAPGADGKARDCGGIVAARGAGIFRPAHPSRERPFVEIGDAVRDGDILALVQVGRLYLPVTADRDGRIEEICAAAGDLVGFASPLFRIG